MGGCREIMLNADMAMWHACTVAAMWHAGMQIVLLGTHSMECYQTQPKTQSGTWADRLLIYPQHYIRTCRHYENGRAKICAHLPVCVRARLHCVPGCYEKCAATWGGTQCEITAQLSRACGQCSWAGRACDVRQMQQDLHAGRGGASVKHCTWVVWCRGGCGA